MFIFIFNNAAKSIKSRAPPPPPPQLHNQALSSIIGVTIKITKFLKLRTHKTSFTLAAVPIIKQLRQINLYIHNIHQFIAKFGCG